MRQPIKKTNVNKWHIMFLLFLCVFQLKQAHSRTFVLLEEPTKEDKFQLNHFTLNTMKLYKVDYNIELYNVVFPSDHSKYERIILFSILPDFKSDKLWREIQDTAVLIDAMRLKDMYSFFHVSIGYHDKMNLQRKFYREYNLVKKEGNKYFEATICLMELFEVKSMDPIFPSPYGLLNLKEKPLSLAKYIEVYPLENFHFGTIPILLFGKQYEFNYVEGWRFWKEYLSKTLTLPNGKTAYQFWTAAATNVADYPDYSRGIERFVYLPGTGMIGGSYDFHFHSHIMDRGIQKLLPTNKLTPAEWNENVLNEKLMMASEFAD